MSEHNEIEKAIGQELPLSLQDQATELARLLIGIINHSTTQNQVSETISGSASLNNAVSLLAGKEIRTGLATIAFGTDNVFEDVNIGDIAQGNIIKITINLTSPATNSPEIPDIVRLQVHKGYFFYSPMECVFINIVNLRNKEIEITHIWFATEPRIHVLNPNRALPKRLQPEETWETWIESYLLPAPVQADPYTLVRARLSTGLVISSQKHEDVPSRGFVPGGPITVRILQVDTAAHQTDERGTRSSFLNEVTPQAETLPGTADEYIPLPNPSASKFPTTIIQADSNSSNPQVGMTKPTKNMSKGKKRKKRKQS